MNIIENSSSKRVFYFHGFIYFVPTIIKIDNHAIKNLIYYILDLLIFFDEILIPSEHLTISNNDFEFNFKIKFLSNLIIKKLIEDKKIVTTIWSACNNNLQHYEVMDRYMNIIGAKEKYYYNQIKENIIDISIYKRDTTYQSNKAKSYAEDKIYYDNLIYEDNNILINFSHEKLFLGELKNRIIDSTFIDNAKEAYIKAMPDGNGRVYRSLIYELEKSIFQNTTRYNPINKPSNVDPVLLTYEPYISLLLKIGFKKPKYEIYKNTNWLDEFLIFTKSNALNLTKNDFFSILEYLSTLPLTSNVEINHAFNSIHISMNRYNITTLILDIQRILNLEKKYEKIFYISNEAINNYNILHKI